MSTNTLDDRKPFVVAYRLSVRTAAALALVATLSHPALSAAQTPASAAVPPLALLPDFRPYRVYTGSIQTSALLHADSVCPSGAAVCPFGGGGGIVIAVGRRYQRNHEWQINYEVSVRNARNLFFSATLQQVRFEHRWFWYSRRTNFEPFVGVGGGIAVYGERFLVTTLGPVLSGVGGANYYLSPFVVLNFSLRLEALRFLIPFDTGDGVRRSDGGAATILMTGLIGVSFLTS